MKDARPVLHILAALGAVVLALAPAAAATPIAWNAERISVRHDGLKRIAEGRATFSNGEKADTTSVCVEGEGDAPGWAKTTCEVELRFADGSRIYMDTIGLWHEKTLEARGVGAFKGGTGRFEAIQGSATFTGVPGRAEWSGSYELSARK